MEPRLSHLELSLLYCLVVNLLGVWLLVKRLCQDLSKIWRFFQKRAIKRGLNTPLTSLKILTITHYNKRHSWLIVLKNLYQIIQNNAMNDLTMSNLSSQFLSILFFDGAILCHQYRKGWTAGWMSRRNPTPTGWKHHSISWIWVCNLHTKPCKQWGGQGDQVNRMGL